MRAIALFVASLIVTAALAGCSDQRGADGPPGPQPGHEAGPAMLAMQGPVGYDAGPATRANQEQSAGGPGHAGSNGKSAHASSSTASASPSPSTSGSASPSQSPSGSTSPSQSPSGSASPSQSPSGSASPSASPSPSPSASSSPSPAASPSPATGPGEEAAAWLAYHFDEAGTSGVDLGIAGYRYRASVEEAGEVAWFTLDVSVGMPVNASLRGHAVTAEQLQAYVDGGGSLEGPGPLDGAALVQRDVRVTPLVHRIIPTDAEGQATGQATEATLYLPVDEVPPVGQWPVAAMSWSDAQGNTGTWEYPMGADAEAGHVLLPYMEGPALEDAPAFDVLLTVYGIPVYAAYPLPDDTLPDVNGTVNALGERVKDDEEPEPSKEPGEEDPEEPVFNITYLTGAALGLVPGAPGVAGIEVSHEESADDQQQRFRIVFGVGLPIPKEIEVQVMHETAGKARVHVVLEEVLSGAEALAGGLLPPLPEDVPDVPAVPDPSTLPDAPKPEDLLP